MDLQKNSMPCILNSTKWINKRDEDEENTSPNLLNSTFSRTLTEEDLGKIILAEPPKPSRPSLLMNFDPLFFKKSSSPNCSLSLCTLNENEKVNDLTSELFKLNIAKVDSECCNKKENSCEIINIDDTSNSENQIDPLNTAQVLDITVNSSSEKGDSTASKDFFNGSDSAHNENSNLVLDDIGVAKDPNNTFCGTDCYNNEVQRNLDSDESSTFAICANVLEEQIDKIKNSEFAFSKCPPEESFASKNFLEPSDHVNSAAFGFEDEEEKTVVLKENFDLQSLLVKQNFTDEMEIEKFSFVKDIVQDRSNSETSADVTFEYSSSENNDEKVLNFTFACQENLEAVMCKANNINSSMNNDTAGSATLKENSKNAVSTDAKTVAAKILKEMSTSTTENNEIEKLTESVTAAKEEIQQLTLSLAQSQDTCSKQQLQLNQLHQENEQNLQKIQNLQVEQTKLKAAFGSEKLKYQEILEGYEKTLNNSFAQLEKLQRNHGTTNQHLETLELAFSDIIQKYERCKKIIQGYKTNEDSLLKIISEAEENRIKCEQKYDALKSHAKEQIEKCNKEIITKYNLYETELQKITTVVKRLEIKNSSLQEQLDQKIKECAALTVLCDEVTGKV